MRLGRLLCKLLSLASFTRRLCNFELGCMLKTLGAAMHSWRVRSRSPPIHQSVWQVLYLQALRGSLKHHPRQRALKHHPRQSSHHPGLCRSLPNSTTKAHLPQVRSLLVSLQFQSDLPQEQSRWPKTSCEQHDWPVHWYLGLELQVRWNLFPECVAELGCQQATPEPRHGEIVGKTT